MLEISGVAEAGTVEQNQTWLSHLTEMNAWMHARTYVEGQGVVLRHLVSGNECSMYRVRHK